MSIGIKYFLRRFLSGVATRDANLKALMTKTVQQTWHATEGLEKSLIELIIEGSVF